MSSETSYGIPILEGADPLEYLDSWSVALANALIRPITLTVAMTSGWTLTSQNCQAILGKKALWLDMQVTYSGATLTGAADTASRPGNLTDTTIFTLSGGSLTDWKPARAQQVNGTISGVSSWGARLDPSGAMLLTHASSASSPIQSGDLLTLNGVCLLA